VYCKLTYRYCNTYSKDASVVCKITDYFYILTMMFLRLIGVDLTGILGGDAWTYYKSPAVEAKHICLHCNASNLVLNILQHDKIWGQSPRSKFWGGDLSPHPP